MGHLEDPKLTGDLTVAREFDLGMTGPPMYINMDFIAGGLVLTIAGLASAAVLFALRVVGAAVLLAGAWLATHWLLRESAVWHDRNTDEVRAAQRHAEYAYRLAVDPPAAKELRLFGLADWVMERFVCRRTRLHELQYQATRLREKPLVWSLLIVDPRQRRRLLVARRRRRRRPPRPRPRRRLRAGGDGHERDRVRRPELGARRRGGAGGRGAAPRARHGRAAARWPRRPARASRSRRDGMPAREIRFRDVTFAYPGSDGRCSRASTSRSRPDPRSPSSDRTARARRRSPSCSAGSTTRRRARSRWTAWTCATSTSRPGARASTAVFQDFIRFELPLRDNVAPGGAPDDVVRAALAEAGAAGLAALDTPLARGYEGGTDLSGGQWQRVALARALCAVRLGAGLVLLDEPTAQLDVRGEAEIFDRILAATRQATTILISHRFSTVRHADRICVLEHGRVVELGTHDELMARGGRYRTMFDLQAQRFGATADEEGAAYDVLA